MLQFKAVVAGRLDTIYWVQAGRQVRGMLNQLFGHVRFTPVLFSRSG